MAGITSVKPAMRFCDIDAATRNVIEKVGYGPYFSQPRLRWPRSSQFRRCFYREYSYGTARHDFFHKPSIKLPGEFGERLEALMLVAENGHAVLNNYNCKQQIVE